VGRVAADQAARVLMPVLIHIIPGEDFYDLKDQDRTARAVMRERGSEGSLGSGVRDYIRPRERAAKQRMRSAEGRFRRAP
jgi:hypothetical protein